MHCTGSSADGGGGEWRWAWWLSGDASTLAMHMDESGRRRWSQWRGVKGVSCVKDPALTEHEAICRSTVEHVHDSMLIEPEPLAYATWWVDNSARIRMSEVYSGRR